MTTTPLGKMCQAGPTVLWNDSADPVELAESISYGAVGATCNPVIALAAIRADLPRWQGRIAAIAQEFPTMSESEIGWRVVEEVSLNAAKLLEPAFEKYRGINGRLSMQTDPRRARSADALVEQAVHFASLAPNIIVKVPATKVGVEAIEEATYRGVNINVTVSFSSAQALVAGGVRVDIFDRLPTPFGLLRYGVAPDHTSIKAVATALARVFESPLVRFCGLVEFGKNVTRDDLLEAYDAVIYAAGASEDVPLRIPGEDLPGSRSAREFVAWYSGHPDAPAEDLTGVEAVAVIGVGNVAVDVARILVKEPTALDVTDMPEPVLEELHRHTCLLYTSDAADE